MIDDYHYLCYESSCFMNVSRKTSYVWIYWWEGLSSWLSSLKTCSYFSNVTFIPHVLLEIITSLTLQSTNHLSWTGSSDWLFFILLPIL